MLFSNGSGFESWIAGNCEKRKRGYINQGKEKQTGIVADIPCLTERAIYQAFFGEQFEKQAVECITEGHDFVVKSCPSKEKL